MSDPTGTIARPLDPIERVDAPAGQAALDRLIASHTPELIVVGDPLLMSGEAGAQARAARAFATRLRSRVGVPVELWDERLTTVEATRRAADSGARASVDSMAACVLLESVLVRR